MQSREREPHNAELRKMQSEKRIFDDLARLANGALGTLSGVREEVDAMVRDRMEGFLGRMDLVGREEFETVRLMAEEARAENHRLLEEIETLKAEIAKATAPKRRKPAAPAKGTDKS
ncbi:MAG: accessory factor UbiK family protein [Pseudomonadota bacterium]